MAHELVDKGLAYYCFCSAEELKKQREAALAKGDTPKYNRICLALSKEQVAKNLKDGIPAVIRLKIPDNRNIE
ncbi:hypothetical protein FACS1894166_09500 [Bacilli bacterium]|nr:hypothetical protein FACS1894166_09500 [Bacilli bacterium]